MKSYDAKLSFNIECYIQEKKKNGKWEREKEMKKREKETRKGGKLDVSFKNIQL